MFATTVVRNVLHVRSGFVIMQCSESMTFRVIVNVLQFLPQSGTGYINVSLSMLHHAFSKGGTISFAGRHFESPLAMISLRSPCRSKFREP